MSGKYDDIIGLPHHVSSRRAPMSMVDRAAQFSPFAALTGYDAAIRETARITSRRAELDEASKSELNEKLQLIDEMIAEQPEVTITYFEPDLRKEGGAYIRTAGRVKKIDSYNRAVILTDGSAIFFARIYSITGSLFRDDHE